MSNPLNVVYVNQSKYNISSNNKEYFLTDFKKGECSQFNNFFFQSKSYISEMVPCKFYSNPIKTY